jgi:hypothetical protein
MTGFICAARVAGASRTSVPTLAPSRWRVVAPARPRRVLAQARQLERAGEVEDSAAMLDDPRQLARAGEGEAGQAAGQASGRRRQLARAQAKLRIVWG